NAIKDKVFIAPFKDNKACAVSFTFDDGPKTAYDLALPLFDKFGFKATIFINPGITTEEPVKYWLGTWKEWRDAIKRGHEIGSHSMEHTILTGKSPEELNYQIAQAAKLIEEKLNRRAISFAFPKNLTDGLSLKEAVTHHPAVRNHAYLDRIYDKIFIPIYGGKYLSEESVNKILDLAIKRNAWLIPVCHSIQPKGSKIYKSTTQEFLLANLERLKEKEEDVWVDTFGNVYMYLWGRNLTKIEFKEKEKGRLIVILYPTNENVRLGMPLTVVIDAGEATPTSAIAKRIKGKNSIPVQIKGNLMIFNAVPYPDPIEVLWKE
ncbi:MAG: polysaccharide deacetylase family protein, partial [Candidatus Omnitrophica bacterium]|nr:polysaccharide deacetylase family protein [Candidatus Omnitrophota bacterium]